MSETETESVIGNIDFSVDESIEEQQNNTADVTTEISTEDGMSQIESNEADQTGLDNDSESDVASLSVPEMPRLKIDPEFKAMIPPLCSGELEALKEDIKIYGCRDPLKVLKGESIILDGHHRYQICQELGKEFDVVELDFPSRTEAKIWIIKNQIGRRNLNESQRAMLALTLENLYGEQAKERMGIRTDLGLNLGQGEVGRSAEKAAKDMGVSHQTVTFAKKVATKGVPELAKLVEAGEVAVSAAAAVASRPTDIQRDIVERVETELKDGKKPNISSIIRNNAPIEQVISNDDADKRLDKVRKSQEANLKLLKGIERVKQPENIVGIRKTAQEIVERLLEIETKSLDPTQNPELGSVIEVKHFKTLMDGVVPITNQIKLKSNSDGMSVIASNNDGTMVVEAFLPKEAFAKYEELGEIGLDAAATQKYLIGQKKSMRLIADLDSEKLHMTFGESAAEQSLLSTENIRQCSNLPDMKLAYKVIVPSKEFVHVLERGKDFITKGNSQNTGSRYAIIEARFEMSDDVLALVAETIANDRLRTKCINTSVVAQTEQLNSRFNLKHLLSLKQALLSSKEVTLSFGQLGPMIIDLMAEKTMIRYFVDSLEDGINDVNNDEGPFSEAIENAFNDLSRCEPLAEFSVMH